MTLPRIHQRMPITILSEETINKIAAGEVIERPSNVVKELIENALDAGGRSIDVEVRGAGRQCIRVRDNGTGMTKEDLVLAVMRHATSKITRFPDLETLNTFGFRGEALPSIAAVSHLLLQSQVPGAASGWELKLSGGKIVESRTWAGAPGTTVEVTNLFYNTPARAKFLKSDTTERHRIIRTIEELSLVWSGVAFHVVSEGKSVLSSPAAAAATERIIDVLGKEFSGTLIPVNVDHPQLRIDAFITRAEHSLSDRNHQFLFVNRRPVNLGKIIMHALYDAYRESLPSGRHPGAIIFLEIDPAEIDVNIHPTKREVRFSSENELHGLVSTALKGALTAAPFAAVSFPEFPPSTTSHVPRSSSLREPSSGYAGPVMGPVRPQAAVTQLRQDSFVPRAGEDLAPHPLAQAFGLYLIVQKDNELLIIDQHAAAERIRYELYRAEWEKKHIAVQSLLLPITIELAPSQAALLKENIPLLKEAGWEIDEFGASTMRISGLPSVLGTGAEAKNILAGIIQALAEENKLPRAEKIETIIRHACRASIRAGDPLSSEEAGRLLRDLFRCQSPHTCPHGRPTIFRLPRRELAKYFGRK